ncbi:hypothetical protein [Parasphingorhabdus flavimaris]|uniref:hypothetical protein n=1 Tax=Parasphingorhabdus flavimaris TaxID=266812 RepID=UPI00300201ED
MRRYTLPLSGPIFAASLILAGPALAQDHQPEAEMVDRLNDPAFQDDMVTMMSGFMMAMMDLPIGQFAHAMGKAMPEEMRRDNDLSAISPDATLGELARRDDPDLDRDAEAEMRRGVAMMGIIASEFGALLPQLQAMGNRMKRRMDASE